MNRKKAKTKSGGKKAVILTAIGKDRPGIVASVSKVLFETGCNIEDSSMTILRNDFAMILMVGLPKDKETKFLNKKLEPVRKKTGLSIVLRDLQTNEIKAATPASGLPYMISVYGTDKPGIVYRISQFLAAKKINITDVETKIVPSQNNEIYVMFLEASIPSSVNTDDFSAALNRIAAELHIDITAKPIESFQL